MPGSRNENNFDTSNLHEWFIDLYSKVEGYPAAPIKHPNSKYQNPSPMVVAGPQLHNIIDQMNEHGFRNLIDDSR